MLKKELFVFVVLLLVIIILPNISADIVDNNTQENETTPSIGFVVSPREINLNLVASADSKETTTVTRIIRISNYLENMTMVNVTQTGLDNIVFVDETSFNLSSGESKDINIVFTAPTQAGIFTGEILINSEVILVSLDVNPDLLLSDSNSSEQGEDLETQITLTLLLKPLIIIFILVIIIAIVSILVKKRKTNK